MITTQIDRAKPIKIVNHNNQMYASLADAKKVLNIKDNIKREINQDLTI